MSFCIVLVLIVNLFIPVYIEDTPSDVSQFKQNIAAFRKIQQGLSDSIRIEKLQNRGELDLTLAEQKLRPFPFDPNGLPAELWKKIGLTDKQIKSIKNYESKSGRFRRKEDLKKMYAISDVEYQVLEPYIRIKSPFKTQPSSRLVIEKRRIEANKRKQPKYQITEINSADTAELKEKLHLPGWLASRVLKYRKLLGGFYTAGQLLEVYGFDSTRFEKTTNYVVTDPSLITKLNINTATFKQFVRHPYLSYELTREIVNQRIEKGSFISTEELLNDEILSESLYLKLKSYLTIE